APPDQELSWKSWDEVLRDQSRNVLFNYLGLGEDSLLKGRPDCADFVYFLRAYFAFKMGLPFGYSNCSRGTGGPAPPPPPPPDPPPEKNPAPPAPPPAPPPPLSQQMSARAPAPPAAAPPPAP